MLADDWKTAEPLRVVLYPDPVLLKKARAVTPAELKVGRADGHDLHELVHRMIATMYQEDGIGLAAPQVGISLRLWVADPKPDEKQPLAVFNPELLDTAGSIDKEEGCLSIPEVRGKVKRFQSLTVKGVDLDGQPVDFQADELLARIAQHETDHLDGILFITKLGTAARFMIRSKLRVLEEEYELMQRRRKK